MASFAPLALVILAFSASALPPHHVPEAGARARRPPVPAWPEQFVAEFVVQVYIYGPKWNSTGVTYYDWTTKTFRADYIDWCLPLFDSGSIGYNNYTCTFLATEGNMYFVNHTSKAWEDDECCLFQEGLAAIPPDWMKNTQYNGTAFIREVECDVWWFPGTPDPENPCYGYWDAKNTDPHTPIRFFGLSSVNRTVLDYYTFNVGPPPKSISLKLPNMGCSKECKPPQGKVQPLPSEQLAKGMVALPHFPSCG